VCFCSNPVEMSWSNFRDDATNESKEINMQDTQMNISICSEHSDSNELPPSLLCYINTAYITSALE